MENRVPWKASTSCGHLPSKRTGVLVSNQKAWEGDRSSMGSLLGVGYNKSLPPVNSPEAMVREGPSLPLSTCRLAA